MTTQVKCGVIIKQTLFKPTGIDIQIIPCRRILIMPCMISSTNLGRLYQQHWRLSTKLLLSHSLCPSVLFFLSPANELDRSKWDEDWDKSRGAFPFSEKLGEISDKIGSTIDDTLNKFRKKERDDSPDRIR